MNEKVSIIVPVYMAEKWLERCIESLISQTYENIEIILIDDGSKDRSSIICDEYSKRDNRIKVIHKENEGVSAARNLGISLATGKYLQFVDSDDTLEQTACEILVHTIKKNNSQLVICGLNIYKNEVLLRTPHLKEKEVRIKESFENYKYIYPVLASPCNKLYKRELFKHKFDVEILTGEDLLSNLEYIKNIDMISCIENCLYNVNLDNEKSLNRKFNKDKLKGLLELKVKEKELLKEIYGDKFDINFYYMEVVRNVHSFYRTSITKLCYKEIIGIMKLYSSYEKIKFATQNAMFDRIDYKLFNIFLKNDRYIMMYLYFKLRMIIEKRK